MDKKEYLNQGYRLNQIIESELLEIEKLKEMSLSVSAMCYDSEVVQSTRNTDAYFIKCLEKIDELRREIDEEVKLIVELKKQIRHTIMSVDDKGERMVLVYRYLQNKTWEQIGEKLSIDERTSRRWHDKALKKLILPKNPIKI